MWNPFRRYAPRPTVRDAGMDSKWATSSIQYKPRNPGVNVGMLRPTSTHLPEPFNAKHMNTILSWHAGGRDRSMIARHQNVMDNS